MYNREIKIGKLILIRDENLPPLKWRIDRICNLHQGSGLIRVVSLKTVREIIQPNSLPKICVLSID